MNKENKPYFINENDNKVSSLEKVLKDDYNFYVDELENYFENSIDFNFVFHDENNGKFIVYFSANSVPYCCGVIEIGNLSSNILPKRIMDNLFKYFFKSGLTFMINTISGNWEEYLEESTHFTKVKTFNNAISGNDINIWISNN